LAGTGCSERSYFRPCIC